MNGWLRAHSLPTSLERGGNGFILDLSCWEVVGNLGKI